MTTEAATPGAQAHPDSAVTPPVTPPAAAVPPAPPPAEPVAPPATPEPPAAEPARKDGEPPAPPKAPGQYALTMPDSIHFDDADRAAVEAEARERDLTNEEAQALLEKHATKADALAVGFLEQIQADPDYGGDRLDETVRLANLALDRVRPAGTPRGDELRQMLKKTGLGNHPAWVSAWADVGKLMAEDHPPSGRAGAADERDAATVLYGDGPAVKV